MVAVMIDGIARPDMQAIAALRDALRPYIFETPVFTRPGAAETDSQWQFKFECLQASGTFKARGAFSNMLALSDAERARGVTAVSAGNHAVAVAYAAMQLGLSAKVVMLATANPARVALCRAYGAEILLEPDGAQAFARVQEIERAEGRIFIHPFNGYRTVLGTATLGAEWAGQSGGLDAVVRGTGGGCGDGVQARDARGYGLWRRAGGGRVDGVELRQQWAAEDGQPAEHCRQSDGPAHRGL